jgi:hypothetical protein
MGHGGAVPLRAGFFVLLVGEFGDRVCVVKVAVRTCCKPKTHTRRGVWRTREKREQVIAALGLTVFLFGGKRKTQEAYATPDGGNFCGSWGEFIGDGRKDSERLGHEDTNEGGIGGAGFGA